MANFTLVQQAAAAGRELALEALVEFYFSSGTMRLWSGSGFLDFDGVEWTGSGVLGSISALPFGENDSADKVTFQLSGVNPQLVQQVSQGEPVQDRDVAIYGLFFDLATSQPLGGKFFIRTMIMDKPSYSAKGPSERAIQLSSETIWTARNLASFAVWSDRDQQTRYPGDRGCQFIPSLKSKEIPWPIFS
jgi:hypothetical protein